MTTPEEERGRFFQRMDTITLLKEIGALLDQLEHLVHLGPLCYKAIRNYQPKVTQQCAAMLLKDSTPLYQTLELGMERLLEQTSSLDRGLRERTAEMLKTEHYCTGMLSKFFEVCRMLPYAEITPPVFVRRSQEVLRRVQAQQDVTDEEVEQRLIGEEFDTKPRKEEPAVTQSPVRHQVVSESPSMQPMQAPAQPTRTDLIMSAYSQPDPFAVMRANQMYAAQMMPNPMFAMMYPQFPTPPAAALRTYNPFEAHPRPDPPHGNPFL